LGKILEKEKSDKKKKGKRAHEGGGEKIMKIHSAHESGERDQKLKYEQKISKKDLVKNSRE